MNRIVRPIILFAYVFAASFTLALSANRTFDKKFSVSPGGTLVIKSDLGSLNITGTDDKEVSVHADLEGRQRDIDEFEITAQQTADGVEVHGRNPRSGRLWNWGGNDLNVTFTIKVPREYSVRMETAGGNITVNDVKGKLNGGTSGGDIHLRGIAGTVDLETSGGNIRAEQVQGKVHMETSGGDIRIAEISGDVDVNTSGGNIAMNTINGKVRAETSGGNISVKVLESNKGVFAETSGGNIDIIMPKNISATIDASTSGGDVSCDFPITMSGKISESRIRGTVNGGGNVIHAETSGGNIRIRGVD